MNEQSTTENLVKLDFADAIRLLKKGQRVRRAGWNGKGMWLALTEGSDVAVVPPNPDALTPSSFRGAAALLVKHEVRDNVRIGPHIDMRAADGTLVIGWLASQTDMLAEDWEVVL